MAFGYVAIVVVVDVVDVVIVQVNVEDPFKTANPPSSSLVVFCRFIAVVTFLFSRAGI